MRFLVLFFIAVPLGEMLLLFEVSDRIGALPTLSLVVLTAVIGVQILKRQGLSTLLRANQRLQSGQLPAQEIVEGMMLAGAGALLLTPGFITDTIGFALLTGPVRRMLARKVIKSGVVKSMGGDSGGSSFSYWSSTSSGGFGKESFGKESASKDSTTFEGEYVEEAGSLTNKAGEEPGRSDKLH
jgi:UPF0716 protein FxsA